MAEKDSRPRGHGRNSSYTGYLSPLDIPTLQPTGFYDRRASNASLDPPERPPYRRKSVSFLRDDQLLQKHDGLTWWSVTPRCRSKQYCMQFPMLWTAQEVAKQCFYSTTEAHDTLSPVPSGASGLDVYIFASGCGVSGHRSIEAVCDLAQLMYHSKATRELIRLVFTPLTPAA
jgi:hypothetical protein